MFTHYFKIPLTEISSFTLFTNNIIDRYINKTSLVKYMYESHVGHRLVVYAIYVCIGI